MRIGRQLAIVAALTGVALGAQEGRASGPEVGANVGVAVPVGKYQNVANPGGTIGITGGYRFSMGPGVSLGLIANPQFTLLPTRNSLRDEFDSLTSMFIFGVGPKLVIGDGPWIVSVGGQGGYYRDMSGPLSEDGAGWNIFGDVGYEVFDNATVGLWARFDQANLLPALDASDNATRQVFTGGLSFNVVFAEPPPPPPAPAPPPPPAAAPAKRKIVLRGVNFDFDKYNIRPDAKPILDEAINVLKGDPQIRLTVDGYTDSIGTEAYNQALSERRANAVARYLEAGGIAAGRLKPVGHGESNPVASNETADGRAQNRRVELNPIGN